MLPNKFRPIAYICLALLVGTAAPTAAATGQQVLRLLVWKGYAPQAKQEEFKRYIAKNYDVDLTIEVAYILAAEDAYEALRLRKADIASPAHNRINDQRFKMIDAGLLLPLNLEDFPNASQLNPSFKRLGHLVKNGVHYGMPFAWGPYGIIYNSDLIDVAPTSLNVLWEPQYQNKISIGSIGENNIYLTALAMGYEQSAMADFSQLNNEQFRTKLAALVSQAKTVWEGVDTADEIQGLSLATSWGFSLTELQARGENWKWVYPLEGVPGWIDNHVISKAVEDNPQLRLIAQEWVNFTLSAEFQREVLVATLSTHPVNQVALDSSNEAAQKRFYARSISDPTARVIPMPEIDRRTRNGMDLIWKSALQQSELGSHTGITSE